MMIAIIDVGTGNLKSIQNMLGYIGVDSIISNDYKEIKQSDRVILPGVGSFDSAMRFLKDSRLMDALNEMVVCKRVPCLGICLGMQMLTNGSEEGQESGLGWINGYAFKFKPSEKYKVPHIGWNYVKKNNSNDHFLHPLVASLNDQSKYYFVHSYYVETKDPKDTLLWTDHGISFASAIGRDNIMGVQFHPEKSHKYGVSILKNYLEKC